MTFYDLLIHLKHPMRFESQTHPQDDNIDGITDCSTLYDQAPAVALASDWPREDGISTRRSSVCAHCY